jgi:hypothetical protein
MALISIPRSFVASEGSLAQLKTKFSEAHLKRRKQDKQCKSIII